MHEKYAAAFNRWMDEYTKDPEAFMETHKCALHHMREKLDGKEPTYGDSCATLFEEFLAEV